MKRELSVWEYVFANDTSDKGLISKIYKELIQLNTRKINNPIKKWAKDLNRHFSKEDIQRAQRHMKGCSITSHRRDANENHNEIPLHTSQMAIINKSTNNKCWQECGEKGTLIFITLCLPQMTQMYRG